MNRRRGEECEQMDEAARPARRRRGCQIPGCGKQARSRSPYCAAHRLEANTAGGGPSRGSAAARPDQESGDDTTAGAAARARAAFQERLASGDYRGLFGERLGELMAQAAAEEGIDDEIGALRIVMARLLAEESDPQKLAQAVARLAGVSIQAARVRRAISGLQAEGITDAVTQILLELDGK